MARFNLDDYEPVEDRLAKFWADHPGGAVRTQLLSPPDQFDQFIVRAEVYRVDPELQTVGQYGGFLASGLAHEVVGGTNVNKTSALENCETSAIGRALANAGYAPKGARASREEMDKVNRYETAQGSSPPNPENYAKAKVLAFTGNDKDRAAELWTQTLEALGLTEVDDMETAEVVIRQAKVEIG